MGIVLLSTSIIFFFSGIGRFFLRLAGGVYTCRYVGCVWHGGELGAGCRFERVGRAGGWMDRVQARMEIHSSSYFILFILCFYSVLVSASASASVGWFAQPEHRQPMSLELTVVSYPAQPCVCMYVYLPMLSPILHDTPFPLFETELQITRSSTTIQSFPCFSLSKAVPPNKTHRLISCVRAQTK